jgi:hypothetical protein
MKLHEADPTIDTRPDIGSGLSGRILALRQRELSSLSLAEIALCLRQSIALPYVVPLALEALADQPLLDAELYPGDLLWSLLHASRQYSLGISHSQELADICTSAISAVEHLKDSVVPAAAAFSEQVRAT